MPRTSPTQSPLGELYRAYDKLRSLHNENINNCNDSHIEQTYKLIAELHIATADQIAREQAERNAAIDAAQGRKTAVTN